MTPPATANPMETPRVSDWLIDQDNAGERLDKFLARANCECSRVYFQKCIDNGCVTINGALQCASYRLETNDRVRLVWPEREIEHIVAEDIPLDVLYEDDDLLVINKPAGLVVHPAPGNRNGTLVSALLYREPEVFAAFSDEEYRPGIVHRLDKDTSGILVITKNVGAWVIMKETFKEHRVSKIYLAVVKGHFSERSGAIEAPIGRSASNRMKMAVTPSGRPALTKYRLLGESGNCSLVMVRIYTGRTHQIRVHMAHIGHPVLGDTLYGGRQSHEKLPFATLRQLLHAWKIALPHPVTDAPLQFTAPLPQDMKDAIRSFPEAEELLDT